MFKDIKHRVDSVRYGTIEKRRKWFFILATSLSVFVFLIWIVFFNTTLQFEKGVEKEKTQQGGIGEFWIVFKNGFGVLKEKISGSSEAAKTLIEAGTK